MRLVGIRIRKKKSRHPMAGWCVLLAGAVLVSSLLRGGSAEIDPPFAAAPPMLLESDAPYGVPTSAPDVSADPSVQEDAGGTWSPVVEILAEGGAAVDTFFVRDTTDAGLDLAAELEEAPEITIRTDGTPMVLIYHTHTSESFLPAFTGRLYADTPSRSRDASQTVAAVGETVAQALRARGIGVIHDTTVHDDPVYTGSYDRSWETIRKNLEQYPTLVMTLDIHRDAMVAQDGTAYKPTAEVNGQKAAQIMIITGRDPDGSYGFPNWRQNLHIALQVQKQATDKYGALMRPLQFCDRRYNMNATPHSLLVEFGTHVNTLSEALYAGALFGDALADVLLRYAV